MGARLRSVDSLIAPIVADTVRKIPDLTDLDKPAVKLAQMLAEQIDAAPPDEAAAVLGSLAPKLLATLIELGCTPRARAMRKGGAGSAPSRRGALAAIRNARTG